MRPSVIGRADSLGGSAGLSVSTTHITPWPPMCWINMHGTHGFRVDPTVKSPAAREHERVRNPPLDDG
jgi:hypothetical protein